MAVVAQALGQRGFQPETHGADVVDQLLLLDDALHFQGGGTGHGMGLIGLSVQEAAGAVGQGLHDPVGDQDAADGLVAAAQPLRDDLDVRRDPFLFPRVHRAGTAHAAHHLVQDQQGAVAVADLPHTAEVAGDGGDAAGGGAHDRLGQERDHRVGPQALELRLQLRAQAIQVLRVGLAFELEPVGEAGRHQAVRRAQDGFVLLPPHHVAAGRQRAQRGAVVALPPRYGAGALGLAGFQEVLPRQLDRCLVALRSRGAEPRPRQPARFILQQDVGQVLGRLVGEGAGMGVGHPRGLPTDRLCDAAVAVAEAGDRRAARGVDDGLAIRGMQVNAVATDRDRGDGAGAVKHMAHCWVALLAGVMAQPNKALLRQIDADDSGFVSDPMVCDGVSGFEMRLRSCGAAILATGPVLRVGVWFGRARAPAWCHCPVWLDALADG